VVALLAEDADGGREDPVADILFVGGTDARQVELLKRMFLLANVNER
jgi:hypothetical protein